MFVDGTAKRLRPTHRREAVLAAWVFGEDGRKHRWVDGGSKKASRPCGRPSRILAPNGSGIRFWWSATGRVASSGRSVNTFPARPVSAAWRIV
jgi:hypothetical protein